MNEALLIQQSLLFGATAVALWLLRPLLRSLGGAPALYLSWLALPLVLLSPALPRPAPAILPLAYTVQLGKWAPSALAVGRASTAPAGLPWLGLWAAGAIALALLLALRHWQFQRQVRRRRLPAGHSPAWVGLWQARLLLPADFRQRFTAEERRLIRAHERVHAQRLDNLWNLLATALWLLHWFNPLAWWALRRFRADQELAADAAVLRARPEQTGRYLRALAKAQPGGAAALAFSPFAPHPLIERISMLQSLSRRVARPWLALVSSLALLGSAVALTPQASPVSAPAASSATKASYIVSSYVGDRLIESQQVELGSPGTVSLRLSSFKDKDLLVTLGGEQLQPDQSQRVHAHLSLGFPRRNSTEAESTITRGQPLQLAILDPDERQRRAVVEIHRLLDDANSPLDSDQSGRVELELRGFVDGQSIGELRQSTRLGEPTAVELGAGSQLSVAGQVTAHARLPRYIDLRLELNAGGRTLSPRLIVLDGQRASVEFNSEQDRRVIRLELTPRRIQP